MSIQPNARDRAQPHYYQSTGGYLLDWSAPLCGVKPCHVLLMPNAQEKKIFGRRFLLNQRKSTEPQVATANDFQGSDASSDCELKPYAIGNEGSLSARIALSGEVPSLSRTSAIVATQLSKITDNGSLWLQAQASDVIQGDRRWWRFMDEFQVVEGLPSIDDVVTKFSALASVEHGRLRKIINKVTEQVRDHKEAGNAITAADPTNATSVIVSIVVCA